MRATNPAAWWIRHKMSTIFHWNKEYQNYLQLQPQPNWMNIQLEIESAHPIVIFPFTTCDNRFEHFEFRPYWCTIRYCWVAYNKNIHNPYIWNWNEWLMGFGMSMSINSALTCSEWIFNETGKKWTRKRDIGTLRWHKAGWHYYEWTNLCTLWKTKKWNRIRHRFHLMRFSKLII